MNKTNKRKKIAPVRPADNRTGMVAIAHWDCTAGCGTGCTKHPPDCGNSEWFINLKVFVCVVWWTAREMGWGRGDRAIFFAIFWVWCLFL